MLRQFRSTLYLWLLLVLMVPAQAEDDAVRTAKDPTRAGWHLLSTKVDGSKRWFQVFVPEQLPQGAPAVVLLHGGKQNSGLLFRPKAGGSQLWREIAERDKVLLLVPNGTRPPQDKGKRRMFNWDDLREDGPVAQADARDTDFIAKMSDWAVDTYGLDHTRLYVTGASNGGLMAYRLLIEQSDRFAAGAAFIAQIPERSRRLREPKSPRPLMMVIGSDDPIMPFVGGKLSKHGTQLRSAAASVLWWVEANRADLHNPRRDELPDVNPDDGCRVYETRFPALPGGAEVRAYCLHGAGHSMPSIRYALPDNPLIKRKLGSQCRDVEGAELAWAFLREQKIAATSPGDGHTP